MAIVLNQADLLSLTTTSGAPMSRASWPRTARGAPLVVVSAETGEGLDEPRSCSPSVRARDAALARLSGGRGRRGGRARCHVRRRAAGGIRREDRRRLAAALEDAAESRPSAGGRGRASPARCACDRLAVRPLGAPPGPTRCGAFVFPRRPTPPCARRSRRRRTSRPLRWRPPRGGSRSCGRGLPEPWPRLVRDAATARDEEVADRLDRAVSSADLHVSRPRWWSVASLVQKALLLAVLAGALWLLVLAVLGYLRVDEVVPLPEAYGILIPTWLLAGARSAGIVPPSSRASRTASAPDGVPGRGRPLAQSARRGSRTELVVAPVEAELDVERRL